MNTKATVRLHEKAIEQAISCCEDLAREVDSLRAVIDELHTKLEHQRDRAESAESDLEDERKAHAETQGLMIEIADQRDRAIAVGQGFAKLTGADHG